MARLSGPIAAPRWRMAAHQSCGPPCTEGPDEEQQGPISPGPPRTWRPARRGRFPPPSGANTRSDSVRLIPPAALEGVQPRQGPFRISDGHKDLHFSERPVAAVPLVQDQCLNALRFQRPLQEVGLKRLWHGSDAGPAFHGQAAFSSVRSASSAGASGAASSVASVGSAAADSLSAVAGASAMLGRAGSSSQGRAPSSSTRSSLKSTSRSSRRSARAVSLSWCVSRISRALA